MDKQKKKPRVIAVPLCEDDCQELDMDELKDSIENALKGRGNAVMTRLNNEDLEKLDALVEAELFKSRSEAAAYFIQEGINSKKELLDRVMPTIEKIKQLKMELKEVIT